MQPHSRRGHQEIVAGLVGGNLVSARRPSGDLGRNTGAGSKWSRRCCGHATGAVAPVVLFTVCIALPMPVACQCRGPQGPHDSPFCQPFHGGANRHEKAGGMGTLNPLGSAASSAALEDYSHRD
ncbi:hypothetical protein NDU88_003023 [Pleurodeles waltl]|uniref:Uncharacterized protein n=1 Tax=Pleurodeles waltl TaxID=8319 RepID=A0AAV7QDM7_PLEWA|nr:hypothetical protein NDU88_003023 [Pleurodeles waltl]